MNLRIPFVAAAIAWVLAPHPAQAQTTLDEPGRGAVELSLGYAGFVDDSTISHALVGGSARWPLTPRLAVGPEIVYLVGPGADRDLVVTGNVTLDLRVPPAGGRPGLVPYLVAGGGLFRHRDRFGTESFVSSEGAFTGGGGVRAWISRRAYVAGEVRVGWEAHLRYSGHVGLAVGR